MRDQGIKSRAYKRHPIRTRGHLLFNGRSPILVRTLDISIGGLCVVSEITLPIKIQGSIELSMPMGNGRFALQQINVLVIHSIFSNKEDGFRVGLMFINLAPNLQKVIHAMDQ